MHRKADQSLPSVLAYKIKTNPFGELCIFCKALSRNDFIECYCNYKQAKVEDIVAKVSFQETTTVISLIWSIWILP